ncbi:MAG: TonB-dependent receptor [Terriglobia bacterium]|nr:MAG: TonB-dependent receptor [Terriglobia bacterium]
MQFNELAPKAGTAGAKEGLHMLGVRWGQAAIASILALSLNGVLFAQGTADIVGTVTDPTGGVLAGAKVNAKNLDTGLSRAVETNTAGDYSLSLLPVGNYVVSVEMAGFKMFTNPKLTLATGDRARVDAQMQVGDVTQTLEVQGQAAALQTDSSTVGALVTTRAVEDLPVNGRNFIRLVQLVPGATESVQSSLGGGTRPDDRRQTSTVSANGQTDSANNFLLDGMDNNERAIATIIVKPSIDALQEVKVETNMYSAESGRAGGAVINMVTKAGTNGFHGTVFEFLRNDKLDAKDFFNVPQAGNPLAGVKPPFRQNQFGGSLGGPIQKDKTFFFADYEAFRKVRGITQQATVPSACELGKAACNGVTQLGNFSDTTTVIYDPLTHQPYAGNIIPRASIDAVGANYAALFPTLPSSSCTGITCLFISSPSQTQFAHTADLRIDHQFSSKDNFFARYSINNTDTNSPPFLPPVSVAGITIPAPSGRDQQNFPGTAYQRQQSLSLSHTHVFSPALLLQLRAQLARYVTDSESGNVGINVNTAFGGPANVNTSVPGTSGLALLQFQNGGYANLGDAFALPTAYWDTNYQYAGTFTWVKGSHSIRFGANLLRRDWSTFQLLFKANFNINSVQTNSTGTGAGTGGNSFASLLTGYYNQATRNMALVAPQYRDWEIGEFLQDDWRATRWLTLNVGVRYDIFTPFKEKHNAISNFDPTNGAVLAGGQIQVAGQNSVSDTLNIGTQHGDVQPRLGFAATLGHGMVLRGGFGTSYWPNNVASPANLKNAPFVATYTINQTPATPALKLSGAVPPPTPNPTCLVAACGAPAGSNFTVAAATQLDYHYTLAYMFNLMLEKEIGANVLSVGYVGEPVRHLGRTVPNINTNLPPLGPGGCGVTTALAFPSPCQPYYAQIPFVNSVQLLETNGVSNYNALQVQFQRRYRAGLTFATNYTFSQSLSDVGGPGGACVGCAQVLNNFGRDYGPSDFMVKHRFTISANYELPFGKSRRGVAAYLIKGWQLNGIYAFATGQPFTVLDGSARQNSIGITQDRPDVVPAQSFQQNINQWIDTRQFRQQTFGTAGNEGHNAFTMPSNRRLDFSIFKDFAIRESVKLQFRAEAFNITNTPSFGLPVGTISGFDAAGVPTQAGNFGRITTMNAFYTPRDIQFALKLIF